MLRVRLCVMSCFLKRNRYGQDFHPVAGQVLFRATPVFFALAGGGHRQVVPVSGTGTGAAPCRVPSPGTGWPLSAHRTVRRKALMQTGKVRARECGGHTGRVCAEKGVFPSAVTEPVLAGRPFLYGTVLEDTLFPAFVGTAGLTGGLEGDMCMTGTIGFAGKGWLSAKMEVGSGRISDRPAAHVVPDRCDGSRAGGGGKGGNFSRTIARPFLSGCRFV